MRSKERGAGQWGICPKEKPGDLGFERKRREMKDFDGTKNRRGETKGGL